MGRAELIFIGIVLGVLILLAFKIFADVMMEVGEQKAEMKLKQRKEVKK